MDRDSVRGWMGEGGWGWGGGVPAVLNPEEITVRMQNQWRDR